MRHQSLMCALFSGALLAPMHPAQDAAAQGAVDPMKAVKALENEYDDAQNDFYELYSKTPEAERQKVPVRRGG